MNSKDKQDGIDDDVGLIIEGAEGLFSIDDDAAEDSAAGPGVLPPVPNSVPSGAESAAEELHSNEDSEFISEKEARNSKLNDIDTHQDQPPAQSNKPRIGERLVSMGLITTDQLNVALQEKKISGKLLGEVLVDLGFITQEILTTFLAETSGFDVFDPQQTIVDADAVALIDKELAQVHKVLPLSFDGNELRIAMADPYDVVAMDTLRRYLPKGVTFKPLLISQPHLLDALDAAYGYASSINDIIKELEGEGEAKLDLSSLNEDKSYAHPVVRLVNALIFEAVKIGSSDLHFEPEENFVRLRYRVDGVLFTAQILHRQHWSAISQRLKIMANLNIAEKHAPQDGRIKMNVAGRDVDFRVSSLPTVHGENIVMRILDKQTGITALSSLGFTKGNLDKIKIVQEKPEGIIIVTGPTGSGKTTSLYSMLNEINSVDVNIQTLEDPVEYSLPMIRQTAVKEGILDFADGIRSILRQDPDIIFIGEIRDPVTAQMALQASMTGHQVYTTLHTNDSFGAIPRLLDLGLKPGMLAGNVIGVMAQRLVRQLCPHCKEPYTPGDEEKNLLGLQDIVKPEIFRAHQGGCDKCGGQGYKGRAPVAEVLVFDEDLDEIIARGGSHLDMKAVAMQKGFKTMRDDGVLKVVDGLISTEALSRVVSLRKWGR